MIGCLYRKDYMCSGEATNILKVLVYIYIYIKEIKDT